MKPWLFLVCSATLLLLCQGTTIAEIDALNELYEDCRGELWVNSTNWGQNNPCTSNWFGVTCNSLGHVIQIALSNNGLVCELPDSVGNFYMLQNLDLSDNDLVGVIPETIENLESLESINLSHNRITGAIPNAFGQLATYSLSSIDLSFNRLDGDIPSFFQVETFNSVNLEHNNFNCPIPSQYTWTGATCRNVTVLTVQSFGGLWGEGLLIIGFGFSESTITCMYSGLQSSVTGTSFHGTFLTDTAITCPTPIVNSNSCRNTTGSLSLSFGSSTQSITRSVTLLPSNCYNGNLYVGDLLTSSQINANQLCLGSSCITSWPSGGGSTSNLKITKCVFTGTPTPVPNSGNQYFYHSYSPSECSNGAPSGSKCIGALTTIQDCGQRYGNWRTVMPGEVHNGVPGPAIYWWCEQGCGVRSGFERSITYACYP